MAITVREDLLRESPLIRGLDKIEKTRIYVVSGLNPSTPSAIEADALVAIDAVTGLQVPPPRQAHESLLYIFVNKLKAKAVATDTVEVTVYYTSDLIPRGGDASGSTGPVIECSAMLRSGTTSYDAAGNLVLVGYDTFGQYPAFNNTTSGYTYTAHYGGTTTLTVKPQIQVASFPTTRIEQAYRFSRNERNILPGKIIQTYVNTLNINDFETVGDALFWKFVDIRARSTDGGTTWQMNYDVVKAQAWPDSPLTSGWYERVGYKLAGGTPDPNATITNNGQRFATDLQPSDFNQLMLFPTVP